MPLRLNLLTAVCTVNKDDKIILSFLCLCMSQGLLKKAQIGLMAIEMREHQHWLCASVFSFQKLCELNESWHVFFSVDPVNGLIYTLLNFLVCFFFPVFPFTSLLPIISLTLSPFLSFFQVFGFQAGLTCLDSTGGFLPLTPIIPSFSTALYGKLIQMPAYWWVCSTCNTDGNLCEHRRS